MSFPGEWRELESGNYNNKRKIVICSVIFCKQLFYKNVAYYSSRSYKFSRKKIKNFFFFFIKFKKKERLITKEMKVLFKNKNLCIFIVCSRIWFFFKCTKCWFFQLYILEKRHPKKYKKYLQLNFLSD
jgi:hypothetical protein